jgi:hypothetical protein
MRIPRFTAEASLGRERDRQYVTRTVDQTVLAIQPAQIFLPPVDIVSCPTTCGTCSCLRFLGMAAAWLVVAAGPLPAIA